MKSEQATFGERLRIALRQAQLSESATELSKLLARHDGEPVSPQAISGWLNGKSVPRQRNLRALAKLVQMDPAVLRYGEENSGKVREKQQTWKVGALDQLAIDTFLSLPVEQRKLLRELIEQLAESVEKRSS